MALSVRGQSYLIRVEGAGEEVELTRVVVPPTQRHVRVEQLLAASPQVRGNRDSRSGGPLFHFGNQIAFPLQSVYLPGPQQECRNWNYIEASP